MAHSGRAPMSTAERKATSDQRIRQRHSFITKRPRKGDRVDERCVSNRKGFSTEHNKTQMYPEKRSWTSVPFQTDKVSVQNTPRRIICPMRSPCHRCG